MGDWQACTLGDLVKFKGGSVFPMDAQGLTSGDLPFAKVSDMNASANWRSLTGAENWLSVDQARKLKATIHEPGAVAFAKIGVALTYNRRRLIVRPTLLDNNMMSAQPNPRKLYSSFLYYLLQTIDFNEVSAGSALPYLTIGTLNKIVVSVPCMEEQRNIADLLGSLDDRIELNRRMNETLEAMAQAIFRDWFVDFGPTRRKMEGASDPVEIMGGLVTDSARARELADLFPEKLGDDGPPEGWRASLLGKIASPAGSSVSPNEVPADTPYIGLEHMPRRSISLGEWDFAAKVSSNKTTFRKGDILFGKLRPYFHKVGIAPVNGVCSTDIIVLNSVEPFSHAMVAACVSSDEFVAFTDRGSTGTKMPRTSWASMSKFPLALPPTSVSKAFSSLAEPMFERIFSSIHENRALAAMRDLLLPKLMSGQIRLREVERQIEAVA